MTRVAGRVAHHLGRLRPGPKVRITPHRGVPVWVLRGACAVVATGGASLVATNTFMWLVAAGLIVGLVVQPWGPGAPMLAVGAGLALLASDPFVVAAMPLAFGAHLIVVIAAQIGDLPWAATIERSLLVGPLRRFLVVQAFVQVMALGAAQLTGQELPLPWVPLVAGVLLVLLAWGGLALMHRYRR